MAFGALSTSLLRIETRDPVAELLSRQPAGTALLREFYADPPIFARDLSTIHMKHWLCVGHASRIPNPGDWFVFDIAEESLILVRGRDGVVRALVNVCRHRGSHVCYETQGCGARAFVCPYHGWTYDLDGRLRAARHMGEGFDASQYSLRQVHVRTLEGLLFVCFADDPPRLDEVEATLRVSLGRYGWADAVIAHRKVYGADANWKLVTENYQECYHCRPAHPEFARFHATERPDAEGRELRAEAERRWREMGLEIPTVSHWPVGANAEQEGIACYHDATCAGAVTGSEDGKPVAPLMGDLGAYDGGFTYVEVGPASFFLAYADYGVMYLFVPREVQRTDMEVIWLVRGGAREGVDYDLARLIWMWDVTSVADKRIIDHNQKGVNSRYYRPGPYGPMEATTRRLSEWYLEQLRSESDPAR
jgi:phenylpropionate dioxygenase-like ring-hydroxylating dioxygenase large terminal subunit